MRTQDDLRRAAPLVLGALGAVLAGAATLVLGPIALALYAVLVLGLVLADRAAWAVTLVLVSAVFLSSNPGELPLPTERFWQTIGGVAPNEALVALAVAATWLDARRRGWAVRGLGPFAWPVGLLAFAIVFGTAAGVLLGNGLQPTAGTARAVLPLAIVPFLVVNVLRTREDVERAVTLTVVVLVVEVVLVLGLYATGRGTVTEGTTSATSLAPEPNLLALVLICAPVAARLVGRGRPALDVAGLIGLLSLVLSLRRSFYLAIVLALAIILVVGVRAPTRRLVLVGAAAVVLAGSFLVTGGLADRLAASGTVGERIANLDPRAIAASKQDRYRQGERANVLLELRESPVVGLGAGGAWQQRTGVSIDLPDALRAYVHSSALWFWMMLGLPGLLAYLWIVVTLVREGLRLGRGDPSPAVRAASLTVGAAAAGLALVELTAAFTGPFTRTDVLVGGAIGLLAAASATRPTRTLGADPAPPVSRAPVIVPPREPRTLEPA